MHLPAANRNKAKSNQHDPAARHAFPPTTTSAGSDVTSAATSNATYPMPFPPHLLAMTTGTWGSPDALYTPTVDDGARCGKSRKRSQSPTDKSLAKLPRMVILKQGDGPSLGEFSGRGLNISVFDFAATHFERNLHSQTYSEPEALVDWRTSYLKRKRLLRNTESESRSIAFIRHCCCCAVCFQNECDFHVTVIPVYIYIRALMKSWSHSCSGGSCSHGLQCNARSSHCDVVVCLDVNHWPINDVTLTHANRKSLPNFCCHAHARWQRRTNAVHCLRHKEQRLKFVIDVADACAATCTRFMKFVTRSFTSLF